MGLPGALPIVGFAIFPAAMLTAFVISHFRRRLGWRLALRSSSLGVIAAVIVIGIHASAGPRSRYFPPGVAQEAARAFFNAALVEEGVKFLLLYFVVREHKDCDSGGDLFSAAMLIGLGFAALENVFYLLAVGEAWLSLGMMRGVLAVPGHAIFGCFMGYFAARAFRGQAPTLNWVLAFGTAFLAHGFYDLPLMVWRHLEVWPAGHQELVLHAMFWVMCSTLVAFGLTAMLFCRRELVEIFAENAPDQDVHLPARWAVRPWRWIGNLMIGASALAIAGGILVLRADRPEGAFLILPSIFPQAFGWIMRLRPPSESPAALRARIARR